MVKEIHVDVGGGDGNFYRRLAKPASDFLAGRKWIVIDPCVDHTCNFGGVHFQPGGIYPGKALPFPDNSIAGLDANFILREDQPRFAALLTEAYRVLQREAELVICDYQHVINDLVVWAGAIPAITDFYMSKPRQAELGERSHEADIWLALSDAVDPRVFFNYCEAIDDQDLKLGFSIAKMSPKKYFLQTPYILSFQKN